MPIFVMGASEAQKFVGLRLIPVPVVGTGSMYPSLYWDEEEGGPDNAETAVIDERRTTPHMYHFYAGFSVAGRTYLARPVGRGDLVAFQSGATRQVLENEGKDPHAGFIKRVIGLPGEQIELRDGFVFLNGELLDEPYIYRPRSTFAGLSLPECQVVTVPEGSYLVLGDNRKVSSDSRGELGFIKHADITFVLPYHEQTYYQSLWRDPSGDEQLAGSSTLEKHEFYNLLNQLRAKRGLKELTPTLALERSSAYSAGGDNLKLALDRAHYHNIIVSEFSVQGRFSATEMLENLMFFDNTAQEILDPRLTDIGVSDVNHLVNGCPTEVIVGHLGGYVPAEYDSATIASWQRLRDNLREVLPSWEQAESSRDINHEQLSELVTIYRRRLNLAEEILAVMTKKEWLSDSQTARIQADTADAKRAGELSRELNGE